MVRMSTIETRLTATTLAKAKTAAVMPILDEANAERV
jgi:hypothetical protein